MKVKTTKHSGAILRQKPNELFGQPNTYRPNPSVHATLAGGKGHDPEFGATRPGSEPESVTLEEPRP